MAGGPYEEHRFHSIGSGSVFARGSLKKLYADDMPVGDAVLACVQALYDAADDDSATGGPDLTRRIFPVIATMTDDGFRQLTEAESEEYAEQVVQGRMTRARRPAGSAATRPASAPGSTDPHLPEVKEAPAVSMPFLRLARSRPCGTRPTTRARGSRAAAAASRCSTRAGS